eukprot:scaffold27811_cov32-Phaeocystis_antarctica.AAC.1
MPRPACVQPCSRSSDSSPSAAQPRCAANRLIAPPESTTWGLCLHRALHHRPAPSPALGTQPRPSVSGAVMGLLVLRIALDPAASVVVGRWQLPVARLLVCQTGLEPRTSGPQIDLLLTCLSLALDSCCTWCSTRAPTPRPTAWG